MRWLTAPDLFDAPDPDLLDFLNISRIARNYNVAPWELMQQPAFWMELGALDMEMQQHIMKNNHKPVRDRS